MSFEHVDLVLYAKTWGLFYLIGFSLIVLVYACWPSNRSRFDDAANRILDDEDTPCQ